MASEFDPLNEKLDEQPPNSTSSPATGDAMGPSQQDDTMSVFGMSILGQEEPEERPGSTGMHSQPESTSGKEQGSDVGDEAADLAAFAQAGQAINSTWQLSDGALAKGNDKEQPSRPSYSLADELKLARPRPAEQLQQSLQSSTSSSSEDAVKRKAFNFQAFLDKMRHPSAFPLVKAMKNFIGNYSHPIVDVSGVVDHVHQFLDEMDEEIAKHALFQDSDEADLLNASEGVEKYLLSKLYKFLFQPQGSDEAMRDQALESRLKLLSFVKPEHLDLPEACVAQETSLANARTELIKIDSYKAPRDKLICILNAVKILQGVLESAHGAERTSADDFFPLLVYVVLQSNPPNLWSNVLFIQRFRHPARLHGEAAYYLTNLESAASFLETMHADRLTINEHEFDQHLDSTIARLPPPKPPAPAGRARSPSSADGLDGNLKRPTRPPPPLPRPGSGTSPKPAGEDAKGQGASSSNALSGFRSFFPSLPFRSKGPDQTKGQASTDQSEPPSVDGAQRGIPPSTLDQNIGQAAIPPVDAETEELLRAVQEPPVQKFLDADASELKLGDIPLLLADYKRLAKLNDKLAKTLALNIELS